MTKAAKLPRNVRKAIARHLGIARIGFDRTEADPRHVHPCRNRDASAPRVAAYKSRRDAWMQQATKAIFGDQA